MVDCDNVGPIVQLPSKLSRDFSLCGMSILQNFQRVIFPYCLRLEKHGWVCW